MAGIWRARSREPLRAAPSNAWSDVEKRLRDPLLADAARQFDHDFRIGNTTLQIEIKGNACALVPEHMV